MPGFTPPAPYQMEDNPDSMIDHSDPVFINPVGTGYSAAVAPNKNRNFWGVDQGCGFAEAVHQALPDEEQPLEFAEIPVRRIVRHRTQLRARVQAARGRRRPERHYAAVVDPRLPAGRQPGRRAADRRGRCVVSQETRRHAGADRSRRVRRGSRAVRAHRLPDRIAQRAACRPGRRDEAVAIHGHRHGNAADLGLRHCGLQRARQFAVPDDVAAGTGAGARFVRRPRDRDLVGHRRQDRPELRRQRPDDDGRDGRLYGDVEQLPERAVEVHVEFRVHRPERPGVPELGFPPHRPDRRAAGHRCAGERDPLHGRRSRGGDGVERRPEGVVGERPLRFRHAVLPDRDRPAANAARGSEGAAEPVRAFLSVGAHGVSRRRLAYRAQRDLAAMYDATVSDTGARMRIRALQATKSGGHA